MMKKYVVIPDFVISKNDGQKHWVSADRLISLHSLNRNECIICDPKRPETYYGYRQEYLSSLPCFSVRYGGEYENGN